jgi:hypothetical protein
MEPETDNYLATQIYVAPDIEVIDIKLNQNILLTGSLEDMPGEDW